MDGLGPLAESRLHDGRSASSSNPSQQQVSGKFMGVYACMLMVVLNNTAKL